MFPSNVACCRCDLLPNAYGNGITPFPLKVPAGQGTSKGVFGLEMKFLGTAFLVSELLRGVGLGPLGDAIQLLASLIYKVEYFRYEAFN